MADSSSQNVRAPMDERRVVGSPAGDFELFLPRDIAAGSGVW